MNYATNTPQGSSLEERVAFLEDKAKEVRENIRERGREFVYQPTKPRRRAGRTALKRLLQTFYDGSLEQAVAAHLDDPNSRLAPEELERIAQLIQEARSRER